MINLEAIDMLLLGFAVFEYYSFGLSWTVVLNRLFGVLFKPAARGL